MFAPILAAAAAAFVLLNILVFIVRQLRSPLRTVPGPFVSRLGDAWYAWKVYQGSFQQVNIELHEKHGTLFFCFLFPCSQRLMNSTGKVIRYGPNRYSINDLAAVKVIYGLGNAFPKSPWYSTWASPGQWSIFSDQSVRRHAHNRKQYAATYAMSALIHYEQFVDECADIFVRRLSELSAANASVDMTHWFQCYAFDVIGMITYGKRLGFLDSGEDVGNVISSLEEHLGYATLIGIWPSLHGFLFPLKNWWAGSKGSGRGYIINFTKDRMRESQASPKAAMLSEDEAGTQDFLTKFQAKRVADPENFTSFHVLSGCVSNMVAGSDTTAISLSAVLYYLLKHPACMQRLQSEVDDLAAKGELSRNTTFKESQQMPYLQAVIKEALRLHPATGLPLERVVPEGGATISGHFFPEDVSNFCVWYISITDKAQTIVGINTWVAHRDRDVFGEDAEAFLPERWLDSDTTKLNAMNRHWMPVSTTRDYTSYEY